MVYNNQEDKNFSLKEKKKKWFLHSLSSLEAGASKKQDKENHESWNKIMSINTATERFLTWKDGAVY